MPEPMTEEELNEMRVWVGPRTCHGGTLTKLIAEIDRLRAEPMTDDRLTELLVVEVYNEQPDRVDVRFDGSTWMTVRDGDLHRRPVAGDALRVRVPVAVAIVGEAAKGDDHA